jgi:hypothetical protein
VRAAVTLLIVSTFIATLGGAAVTVYAFRWRRRERFLLFFGLFSTLYGIVLIVRNSVFRLGSGEPAPCRAIPNAVAHKSARRA